MYIFKNNMDQYFTEKVYSSNRNIDGEPVTVEVLDTAVQVGKYI